VLLPAPRHLAPLFVATGTALVIMVGLRDLGSALLFFGAFLTMLYVATGRPAYPALGLLAFGFGASSPTDSFARPGAGRIWLDPWTDVSGSATSWRRACSPWPPAG
jgi:cell division protein FtsW (lipid II flippase)